MCGGVFITHMVYRRLLCYEVGDVTNVVSSGVAGMWLGVAEATPSHILETSYLIKTD